MPNLIITINRECGSGGGEIARLLGAKPGLKVYDRSMLSSIEKQFDMTHENLEQVKAKKTNWWSEFCRFYQQFAASSYTLNEQTEVTPLSIYYAEKVVDKVDKARDTFVKNVADTSRYDARNYDFTFNVTGMAPEMVAEFLADNIRHKLEMRTTS